MFTRPPQNNVSSQGAFETPGNPFNTPENEAQRNIFAGGKVPEPPQQNAFQFNFQPPQQKVYQESLFGSKTQFENQMASKVGNSINFNPNKQEQASNIFPQQNKESQVSIFNPPVLPAKPKNKFTSLNSKPDGGKGVMNQIEMLKQKSTSIVSEQQRTNQRIEQLQQNLKQVIQNNAYLTEEVRKKDETIRQIIHQVQTDSQEIRRLTSDIQLLKTTFTTLSRNVNSQAPYSQYQQSQSGEKLFSRYAEVENSFENVNGNRNARNVKVEESSLKKVEKSYLSKSQVVERNDEEVVEIIENEEKKPTSKNEKSRHFSKKKVEKNETHGDYTVTYSYTKSITEAQNVVIENQFGKVQFLQPINMKNIKANECVNIEQNSPEFLDEDWGEKHCRIVLYNWRDYIEADEEGKKEIEEQLKEEFNGQDEFEMEKFDNDTGTLYLIANAEK